MNSCRDKFRNVLSQGFGRWGRIVATYPLIVSVVTLAVYGAFCAGLVLLTPESRSFYLWAPTRARAYMDWKFLESKFGEEGHSLILYATIVDGDNILEFEPLDEVLKLHKWTVDKLEVDFEGRKIDFEDVCLKYEDEDDCAVNNFLSLWNYDRDDLKDDKDNILDRLTDLHQQTDTRAFLGGAEIEKENGKEEVKGARAVTLVYPLRSTSGASYAFQPDWNDRIRAQADSSIVNVTHFSQRSYDDEVARLVAGDIPIFIGGMTIITTYLALTLGPIRSPARSRVLLGSASVGLVGLAVGAGFGLAAIFGVFFPAIAALLPLILLGVAVDGIIIITDGLNAEDESGDIVDRVSASFSKTGPAILMTSLTAVAAFGVGISTDLPAVSMFCSYAACSFAFAMVIQFTLFVALLTLDERRLQSGRVSYLPCLKQDQCCAKEPVASSAKAAEADRIEATQKGAEPSQAGAKEVIATTGPMQRFVRDYYAPFLLRPNVSAIVVLLFIALAALSGAAIPFITIGLPDSDVLPDDSYVQDALTMERAEFGGRIIRAQVVIRDEDYNSEDTRDGIDDAINAMEDEDFVITESQPGWSRRYEAYVLEQGKTLDEDEWTEELDDFLDDETRWKEDVLCTNDKCDDVELGVRVLIFPKGNGPAADIIEKRTQLESQLKKENLDTSFVFDQDMIVSETDVIIWELTLSNMGFALVAIAFITLVFTPPVLAFWITVCVALIDLDLLGMMFVVGVKLNAVTFVNLVMAVGLSVDYCVHIAHAFDDIHAERKQHAAEGEVVSASDSAAMALTTMGFSIFKGGFTTFLGVLVIAFSSSVAFRTFFIMITFTVIFGMLHGLVLMPVLLAYATTLWCRTGSGAAGTPGATQPSPDDPPPMTSTQA